MLVSRSSIRSRCFERVFLFPPPGVLGCSLLLSVRAFYSPADDVVELTPSNFNKEVIQSDALWLVEFYAPWWVSPFHSRHRLGDGELVTAL